MAKVEAINITQKELAKTEETKIIQNLAEKPEQTPINNDSNKIDYTKYSDDEIRTALGKKHRSGISRRRFRRSTPIELVQIAKDRGIIPK